MRYRLKNKKIEIICKIITSLFQKPPVKIVPVEPAKKASEAAPKK